MMLKIKRLLPAILLIVSIFTAVDVSAQDKGEQRQPSGMDKYINSQIMVACPYCHQKIILPSSRDQYGNTVITCPSCKHKFTRKELISARQKNVTPVDVSAKDADKALALLKEGNARFIAMKMQYPDLNAERRMDTAVKGQKPFAIVLACSDSRAPVEAIFDRGVGDIFVVRVAGNIATDPSVIGSIEYAAEHLNAPLLLIMGHTECGAVKAAISGPPLEGGMRSIQKTIEAVAARVKNGHPGLQGADLTLAVVKENVIQVKKDILSKSEEIKHMAEDGKLKIVTAVYDLKTGVVEWIE